MDSSRRDRLRPPTIAAIALLIIAVSAIGLRAQAPVRDTMRTMFGFGNKEFFKGAWMKMRPDSNGGTGSVPIATMRLLDHQRQIWDFCDWLGIDVIRHQADDGAPVDTALALTLIAARTDTLRQRIILDLRGNGQENEAFIAGAWGRELKFYTFTGRDSVQYPTWPCRFLTLSGGTTDSNNNSPKEKDDYLKTALEQHYKAPLAPNTVIAEGITFNWDSAQTVRMPHYSIRDSNIVMRTDEFLGGASNHLFPYTTNYVVVTGHLFEFGSAPDTARLLKIEVLYEIPSGFNTQVCNTSGTLLYDTILAYDVVKTLATLYVKKSDLDPTEVISPNFDRYQEVALPFDARWCGGVANEHTGPRYPGNASQRINLRVTWLGAENVAIRSIALRDSIGQLVLGRDSASETFQSKIRHGARIGAALNTAGTPYKWPIIARATSVEQQAMHASCMNAIYKLTRDTISAFDPVNGFWNRLPAWTETAWSRELHKLADTNLNANVVVAELFSQSTQFWLGQDLKMPWRGRIPSIAQHNGGRWNLPELILHPDSIEHVFETNLQLGGFTQYVPYRLPDRNEKYLNMHIGRAAAVSRDTRRRLIAVPFSVGRIQINCIGETPVRGAVDVEHFQEPSELRTMANIALCYGARGLHWQVAHGPYNFLLNTAEDVLGPYRWLNYPDFGFCGPFTKDTTVNTFDSLTFRGPDADGLYTNLDDTVTLHDFYTGWGVRSHAVRDIHKWIDRIGPELMELDWRDGYSMHFTAPQMTPADITVVHRPFPNDEIIDSIRTRRPDGTLDSLHRTFVELGLFDRKNPTADPMNDVHHIFLVNRRCFERSDDIEKGSTLGNTMDALAETRTIEVKLNLIHPIDTSTVFGQYTFVRIQEIAADTDTLPLGTADRRALDTMVHPDSVFAITLGPGRAALLRFTYAPPDTSIINGSLEYNNQRKIVWDGESRYHSTYYRWDSTLNDFHVYYRRSIPISSSVPLGSIFWEPIERCVSCVLTSNDSVASGLIYKNRFPSITVTKRDVSQFTDAREIVASIVWQRTPDPLVFATGTQEIMMRDFGFAVSGEILYPPGPFYSRMRRVDLISGASDSSGTAVISSGPGGDFIFWSDDSLGIVGRLRRRDIPFRWWNETSWPLRTLSLSERALVSYPWPYALSRFPTVPSHTHFARKDSTTGIAWQQQMTNAQNPPYTYSIWYRRLHHIPDSDTSNGIQDTLWFDENSDPYELVSFGQHFHPSIDIVQDSTTSDSLQTIREAITWETVNHQDYPPVPQPYRTDVNFQSVFTSTSTGTIFTMNPLVIQQTIPASTPKFVWPNISSLNGWYLQPTLQDSARFAIVYQSYSIIKDNGMTHTQINYRQPNYRNGWARQYSYDGYRPSGSASRVDQDQRYAALYKRIGPGPGGLLADTALRTTRQFLAKIRPGGYVAEGRDVHMRLNDSLGTTLAATLHDVWYADAATARGLRLVQRNTVTVDTLERVRELLRTEYFTTSDSLWLGWQSAGAFVGDSSWATGARLTLVAELVDSASGAVVRMLDSFEISPASPGEYRRSDSVFDLLLGTYYVRLRIDTAGFDVPVSTHGGRYLVAERAEYLEAPSYSKHARRIGGAESTARISAQPNPFGGTTDVRFSITRGSYVDVKVHDRLGREVAHLVNHEWMEPGRYEVAFEKMGLEPGTYVIELRAGDMRAMTKVVRVK